MPEKIDRFCHLKLLKNAAQKLTILQNLLFIDKMQIVKNGSQN